MKSFLLKTSLALMIPLMLGSCSKFLERPPEGQLTEEELFKTEDDVVAFTNGIYTLVGDNAFMGGRKQLLSELLGDEYRGEFFTGDYAEIYRRANSIFGGTRDDFYRKAYDVAGRSNIVLSHLDLASTRKNEIEGTAKFFRAIAHFEVVRMFAQPWGFTNDNSHPGVPLRTELNLGSVNRSTVKEVYDQVIADLKAADDLLPEAPANAKYYSVTKWAARAYLAKVYFQQNDFTNAFKYADEVIKSNRFLLDTDLDQRYSLGGSTEGILSIEYSINFYMPGGELKGAFRSDVGLPNFRFTDQYFGIATARGADKRREWYTNTLQPGFNLLTKYNKNEFDVPLVHLTEIQLIRAESAAETGAANLATGISDINAIMTRAYGGTAFNLPSSANAALVISTTRTERELELVGEGNRVQEIKRIGARSGANIDRRGSVWNCNGMILQFPKGEQDAFPGFVMNAEGGCF
ncbi:MAG: RagB/SusD family nutrient uptake outer membrane protein [Chitinophagaceae bacterium]|nr:MAG: RagB/SusD family nutrient uptake outer membrane protein [Chitinophagaceae bacterium]